MAEIVEEALPLDEAVRKLASIQLIDNILEHGNADRLEIAAVLGWKVVVLKNQYHIGDKVVFFEIGSILPKDAHWSQDLLKDKFTVKTKKLRGFISQGLVLDIKWVLKGIRSNLEAGDTENEAELGKNVPQIKNYYSTNDLPPIENLPVGFDLTNILKITKDEPNEGNVQNASNGSAIPYPFPRNIPKTDEPRLQSNMKFLKSLKGLPYYISVKIDGCSGTYFVPKSHQNPLRNYKDFKPDSVQNPPLIVCSRNNIRIQQEDIALGNVSESSCLDLYWEIAEIYGLKDKLVQYPGYVIQGEIYGPKVQGNRLNMKTLTLAVFNVYNMNTDKYLGYKEFLEFCKNLNLPTVPVIEEGQKFDYTLDDLLEKSKRKYPNSKSPIEGIVIRSMDEEVLTGQRRTSFKVINNEFLLKYES